MKPETKQGENMRLFKCAAGCTLFWGIITYLYAFLNFPISHDSLNEIASAKNWKIALGRFMIPAYQDLVRGDMNIPWLIGVLSLLFLVLAVYVLAKAANLSDKVEVFVASALVVTCPAIFTLAGTYIHDLDGDMLAILLAMLAVWGWRSERKRWLPIGALCIAGTMGLYQSYACIAVTLIMALSVIDLVNGKAFREVLFRGMVAVAMIVAGMLAYMAMVHAACRVAHVSLSQNGYNSLTNVFEAKTLVSLPRNLIFAYWDFVRTLVLEHFGHGSRLSVPQCIMYVGMLCALLYRAVQNRIKASAYILAALLGSLLPVGVSLSMLANSGAGHDLMKCGMIAVSVFALLAVAPLRKEKRSVAYCAMLVMGCMVFTSWQHVVDANQLFFKKELERQAALSFMTRVAEDIDEHVGYVRGETPVLFIGTPGSQLEPYKVMPHLDGYTGNTNVSQISYEYMYPVYYKYILQENIRICDDVKKNELLADKRVSEMPVYPEEGSIKLIDGTLVVKMK